MNNIPEDIQELLQVLESAARTEDETASRVQLPKGQSACLSFEVDEGSGYRSARLSLETPRVEQAVVAAITTLNGRQVDPSRVRRSIHASEWQREVLHSLAKEEPRPVLPPLVKGATVGDVRAGYYSRVRLEHEHSIPHLWRSRSPLGTWLPRPQNGL